MLYKWSKEMCHFWLLSLFEFGKLETFREAISVANKNLLTLSKMVIIFQKLDA